MDQTHEIYLLQEKVMYLEQMFFALQKEIQTRDQAVYRHINTLVKTEVSEIENKTN